MKRITIGYFADGPWAHNALDRLLNDMTIEIAFIVPRYDTKDDYLKNKAIENNIDYLPFVKVNSDEFYETALKYNCDLFVSMSYNQIFRDRIMNLPPLKTINCHAGKLPFYRGRNILNWALINDEKEFGITVHFVDTGIDTGDIILQRTFPIMDHDTYATLLKVAYIECGNILYDAIKQIQSDSYTIISQDTISIYGMYCGIRQQGDELLNWNQSSRDIFNFIRALCDPGPQALSYVNGMPVHINSVIYDPDFCKYKGIPGQIIGLEKGKPMVKTLDSYVILKEYGSTVRLKIGDRFKNE